MTHDSALETWHKGEFGFGYLTESRKNYKQQVSSGKGNQTVMPTINEFLLGNLPLIFFNNLPPNSKCNLPFVYTEQLFDHLTLNQTTIVQVLA